MYRKEFTLRCAILKLRRTTALIELNSVIDLNSIPLWYTIVSLVLNQDTYPISPHNALEVAETSCRMPLQLRAFWRLPADCE